ncbi:hypothetical protein DFP74_3914 [Nocardiopsis sp. Huas11]|uniref:hypothetical protein n=1 Tax=Nocardiopsis sp. Huas11 TaxID=2183912 RepID=UPI000EAD775F|nr:hypothetical protein [Nocardiopsis sp. Huas11]RKS08219.1 hypothetical protein DFP74_3914 [Nocardiopsis sp. Huas11]
MSEDVGGSPLVDVAGMSLREVDRIDDSALACTLREILDPADAGVEVLSAFENSGDFTGNRHVTGDRAREVW